MDYQTGGMDHDRLALEGPGVDRSRRRRRWIVIGAVVLLIAGIGAWFAMGMGAKPEAAPAQQAPGVTVVVPGRSNVERTISASGTLAARREMPVGVAGEGGRVTRVLVEPGQWVGAGQVLATVDRSVQTQTAAGLAAQINVARSDLVLAGSELDRAQKLVGRGFISQADVQRRIATRDAAAARLKVAQATLSEQRARNSQLDIRAPAAGLVLTRDVEPGQIISSASGTLFRMAKGGEMEMLARLSENDLQGLPVGARAEVVPVGDTRSFAGQVWQLSPVIDPQSRQGIARIALAYDPALRPGGFASATIVGGSSERPQLPQSAIMSDEKGSFVYLVGRDNKVVRRNVQTGIVTPGGIAVTAGLNGTERVVLRAGGFLNPGETVKPQRARPGAPEPNG